MSATEQPDSHPVILSSCHPAKVLIVGGGLAGLAAATALAPRGFAVTLLEARNRLGGRASSFQDSATGQLIDTCQHVSMGCCTSFAHFCRTVGIAHLLQTQRCLYFMTPDRRVSRLSADGLPAPWHLARSFLAAHYLSLGEKLRIAWGLVHLRGTREDGDPPFRDWLEKHRQTPRTIERFWGVVLTSALNETVERVGLRYARKVFVDGFLRDRRGFELELPSVPLARLYGEELRRWLEEHHVEVRLQSGVKAILFDGDRVRGVELRQGDVLEADWYVAAVPFDRLLDMLPAEVVGRHTCFSRLKELQTSPITSVHLWYDRPIMELPHVVLIDCLGQWVFNRGPAKPPDGVPGEHYVQVVVSAARQMRDWGHEEVQRRIVAELATLFPEGAQALRRGRVVTEQSATFSAVSGVDACRPEQATPIANLVLAGDWTATGWPATMESAVRSGYRVAEVMLARSGTSEVLVQPEL